jgi:hypothetical protein
VLPACNEDITWGTMNFDYALIDSPLMGKNYFHISRWKEIDPEGGNVHYYRGLEITTAVHKVDYYFYEIDLTYVLMHGKDSELAKKYTIIE